MTEDYPKTNRNDCEIAREASTECDSEKIAELSQELIKALDKQSPHSPDSGKEPVQRKSA